jgi:hypothetical protein
MEIFFFAPILKILNWMTPEEVVKYKIITNTQSKRYTIENIDQNFSNK